MRNFRRKKTPSLGNVTGQKNDCEIDYKNLGILREYTMESGRIVPSRITGASAKHQRQLAHEIKIARYLALMPYCDMHDA